MAVFLLGTIKEKREGYMRKSGKLYDVLLLLLVGAVVLFFGVTIFILPQRSLSQKENRSLATMPKLSLDSITSGEYFKKLGDFYSDQFPMRDHFTATYSLFELSLGKQEVKGVMVNNNALIARSDEDIEAIKANIDAISSVENSILYVPPSSKDVFESPLKNSKIISILPTDTANDFTSLCENNQEYIYYKTDHHWTTRGAYIAYTQICSRLSITPYHEEYFARERVNTDFRGTSFSRSCLPEFVTEADDIVLYRYEGDKKITLLNHENNVSFKGFYQMQHLEQTDKYRVFLGGNYAHVSILNDTPKPKLLLVKDSFANSLVPFLALHFDIEMIDPRYCSKIFLQEQTERTDVDNIMFLLSADTLSNDIFG